MLSFLVVLCNTKVERLQNVFIEKNLLLLLFLSTSSVWLSPVFFLPYWYLVLSLPSTSWLVSQLQLFFILLQHRVIEMNLNLKYINSITLTIRCSDPFWCETSWFVPSVLDISSSNITCWLLKFKEMYRNIQLKLFLIPI